MGEVGIGGYRQGNLPEYRFEGGGINLRYDQLSPGHARRFNLIRPCPGLKDKNSGRNTSNTVLLTCQAGYWYHCPSNINHL